MTKREEFCAEIAKLKQAKKKTRSTYLKRDYDKAIKRMEKDLIIYDHYQRS